MEYNGSMRTITYEGFMFTRSFPATTAKSYRKIICYFANFTVANTPRSPGYGPRAAYVVSVAKKKKWHWHRFSFEHFFFPCQCHWPSGPFSFIHLLPTLCNLSNLTASLRNTLKENSSKFCPNFCISNEISVSEFAAFSFISTEHASVHLLCCNPSANYRGC